VGIIVPRHGNTAVERNRVKRLIREVVRTEVLAGLPPMDIVIRVGPEAYRYDWNQLRQRLVQILGVLVTASPR
jgi:ribonuclease P protein component